VPEAEAPALGELGQYRLLAKIGEGGMGAVYKALHTKLEKVVALKVLPAARLQDTAAVQRFEREMKAVGQLEHPNIVRATDAGEIEGTHYLVMELVDGIDLSALIRRVGPACRSRLPSGTSSATADNAAQVPSGSRDLQGAMTIADACEMIRQAAVGLQEAHEDGMVHRDIKPSNLMLARSRKGRKPPLVKILDLGLALLDDQRGPRRDLTSTGQMMGTLDYMAPEQGGDSHDVGIRADIYALGATLIQVTLWPAAVCGRAVRHADQNDPGAGPRNASVDRRETRRLVGRFGCDRRQDVGQRTG
jgi:serine/threonine protein kinase